jgi:hypothetical protein
MVKKAESKKKSEPAKVGRPSKYTPELVEKAKEYITTGYEEEGHSHPSIVGLALYVDVRSQTLYDWETDEDKEFSDILGKCRDIGQFKLIEGGLKGDLNPAITKLVLGKHGFSEKTETDNTHVVVSHEQWLESLT